MNKKITINSQNIRIFYLTILFLWPFRKLIKKNLLLLRLFVDSWPLRLISLLYDNFILFFIYFFVQSFWFFDWFGYLFSITFFWLDWNLVDGATTSTFYHIARAIWIAHLALARATDEKPVERETLVHVIAATTNINLCIGWHILFKCTMLTSHFPNYSKAYISGNFDFFTACAFCIRKLLPFMLILVGLVFTL